MAAHSNQKKTRPCMIDGCKGLIGEGSITGLCPACYNSLYGWLNRHTARERVDRARRLNLYVSRLCYLLPDDKIEILQPKKRKPTNYIVMPGKVKQYKNRPRYKVMNSRG